jgi:hypothetical protein
VHSVGSGSGTRACGGSGSWGRAGTCTADVTADILDALFDALLVLPVAEVDFKVVHGHAWTWGVELPGAIVTADAGEVLIFDFLAVRETVRVGHWGEGFGVDGGISHHSFKRVIWVRLFELLETGCEPGGWWGLREAGSQPRAKYWG